MGIEYEFAVEQQGEFLAGGTTTDADSALAEAEHYEMMYSADGPLTLKFWRKEELTRGDIETIIENA